MAGPAPSAARALWEKAGRPEIRWMECGHYSAAGFLLPAMREAVEFLASDPPKQPKVQPGPSEPDWLVLLYRLYGLRMLEDLLNPVTTTPEATPGRFRKAGPGPVRYRPVLALGLEVPIRGPRNEARSALTRSAASCWTKCPASSTTSIESGSAGSAWPGARTTTIGP